MSQSTIEMSSPYPTENMVRCRVNTAIPAGMAIATMENGIVCAVNVSNQWSGDFSKAHTVQFSAEDYPDGVEGLREMARRLAL